MFRLIQGYIELIRKVYGNYSLHLAETCYKGVIGFE